jgi:small-conductance mechanosensitive channel
MMGVWPLGSVMLAFVAATAAAFVLRAGVLLSLRRWPRSELLADAIRGPSALWCLAIGLYVANEVAADVAFLSERWHARAGMLLQALVVVSVTLVAAGVAGHAVARVSERTALGGGVTGLARTTSRMVVLVVGLLVALSVLGVQITPVLTALGVGGLAVALALQDTLANLFAGVHILADKPIRVGDYAKIADAPEGVVTDIGWRSTRLRSLANNVIVIPNQTVTKATVTNYSLPDGRVGVGFRVSVDPSTDIDHAERVVRDELNRALDEVPGLLREPPPAVSVVPGFDDHPLEFSIGYSVASFVDQYAVQDQLRRRILQRFRREGISMAAPVRSFLLNDGAATVSTDARGQTPGSGAPPSGR